MSTSVALQILNQNPYQNAGQAVDGFSNNLRYCTVGSGNPVTAEEFNSKIGSSEHVATSEVDADEPLFGTHLREAAATLRKVFGR